jgi:hypothetical protein
VFAILWGHGGLKEFERLDSHALIVIDGTEYFFSQSKAAGRILRHSRRKPASRSAMSRRRLASDSSMTPSSEVILPREKAGEIFLP